MSTILIKDTLRQSIEAASGGAQTVIYTAKGQPTYMNIIEKYDMSTLGISGLSGTHPAFKVGGVEKDKIFIGTYQGVIKNGEFVSQPNTAPTQGKTFETYLTAVRANGQGHHLITNAEWAAIALESFAGGVQPLGNSYYGRSADDATQYGRRVDGKSAVSGLSTGSPAILTGSGTVKFRHNQKYNGISDMAGNLWELTAGVRLHRGELQILSDNNAAMFSADMSASSAQWMAISGETGILIEPNGSGTTEQSIKIRLSGSPIADYTLIAGVSASFNSLVNASQTKPVTNLALTMLKRYALCPLILDNATDLYKGDAAWATYIEDGLITRGGSFASGAAAGIFAYYARGDHRSISIQLPEVGSRPAYYTP